MKTDIFLLLLSLSFHLICWHNTGEEEDLFEHSTHPVLRVLRYCQHSVSQGTGKEGYHHLKEITVSEWVGFDRDVALDLSEEYLSSLHFYTRAEWMCPWSQTASKLCVSLRRMGHDWCSNMFSIHLFCHTWATRNKQSCLCNSENEIEGSKGRERERMGFYARDSHESHLFSRLNICKFHLQTVGQSFQHQRPQFYGLPTLKIFWWEITLSLSVE